MNVVDDKLLMASGLNQIDLQSTIDGEIGDDEEKQKGKNTMSIIDDIHPIDAMGSLQGGLSQERITMGSEKLSSDMEKAEGQFLTPEASKSKDSDCRIVGNKFFQLLSEESHHSKWEEFRRRAQDESMKDDCANLLRRMELDESDSEEEICASKMVVDEGMCSLGELINVQEFVGVEMNPVREDIQNEQVQKEVMQGDIQAKKRQKRQWGPSLRVDRPRRVPEDGRTIMQRAQDLKEAKNTMKGMTKKTSFAFESNEVLLEKAKSVNISFGSDAIIMHEIVNKLKNKEHDDRESFETNNPEVNLPNNLDIVQLADDFPQISEVGADIIVGPDNRNPESWAKIASKSCDNISDIDINDRRILECERP